MSAVVAATVGDTLLPHGVVFVCLQHKMALRQWPQGEIVPICLQQKVDASWQAGKPQAKSPLVYVGIIDDDKNESCVCHVCMYL